MGNSATLHFDTAHGFLLCRTMIKERKKTNSQIDEEATFCGLPLYELFP